MEDNVLRDLDDSDMGFILSTWLRSYQQCSWFARPIKRKIYYEFHEKIVKRIIERPTTNVVVSCLSGDNSVITGYFVYELTPEYSIIHFCYVKMAWRRKGIARAMFESEKIDTQQDIYFTHLMRDQSKVDTKNHYEEQKWLYDKLPTLTYCPYLI